LHESLKNIPKDLLKYIPQFQFFLLNVHPLNDEILLGLRDDGILRSLFLSYIALEDKNRIENVLIEIFKFMSNNPNFTQYFNQLFGFLVKEGYFSGTEIKEMLKTYFSQEEQKKMVTTAQIWEKRGEKRGEKLGKHSQARLTVLRGYFKKYSLDTMVDLSDLTLKEVLALTNGFDIIKEALKIKPVNIPVLITQTTLSVEEIEYVVQCLETENSKKH
jgi:hypothetical protein